MRAGRGKRGKTKGRDRRGSGGENNGEATVGEWRRRVAPDAREKKRKTVGWEMRGGDEGEMRGRKNKGNNDRLRRRDKGESGTSHGGKDRRENRRESGTQDGSKNKGEIRGK